MSLSSYSWTQNPTFTNPSFGIDKSGVFSGAGSSLSSSPFAKGASAGMDPGTALAISAGSSVLSGGIGASGSKKAADKAKAAAEAQAKAVQQAARESPLIGFGMESLAPKHDLFVGGPMERAKAFEDTKLAGALAFSPNTMARERMRLAQELAGSRSQAYGKEMDPFQRFV